jgi:hypothetical protein
MYRDGYVPVKVHIGRMGPIDWRQIVIELTPGRMDVSELGFGRVGLWRSWERV